MQRHYHLPLVKKIAAFIFAPLAAVVVIFLFMLLSALGTNNLTDAIGGAIAFSFAVYLFYFFGLVLILPTYLLLHWMKKDSQRNITLMGGGFGLLVGLILSPSAGGVLLGLTLGLPSGFLLSMFLAIPAVNWQLINFKKIGMNAVLGLFFALLFFLAGTLTN